MQIQYAGNMASCLDDTLDTKTFGNKTFGKELPLGNDEVRRTFGSELTFCVVSDPDCVACRFVARDAQSEEELVAAAKQGDQQAFVELWDKCSVTIRWQIFRML